MKQIDRAKAVFRRNPVTTRVLVLGLFLVPLAAAMIDAPSIAARREIYMPAHNRLVATMERLCGRIGVESSAEDMRAHAECLTSKLESTENR